MFLRLYSKSSCIDVIKNVDRLICGESGNVKVRYEKNKVFAWRSFERGKQYDSFVLATE